MHNFPVIVEGKEYWISRSVAVCGLIFTIDNGLRVLACKRGKGCPDEVGKWCCPCGYIDYNETVKQACIREVKEETNLTLDPSLLYFWTYNDNLEGKQNITFRFWSFSPKYSFQTITGEFGEPDEVDDVEWISVNDLEKYDWAFNHYVLIKDCIETNELLKTLIQVENIK